MKYLNTETGIVWDITSPIVLDRIKDDDRYVKVEEKPKKTVKKK